MVPTSRWWLYDALLDGMPSDMATGRVRSCAITPVWTYVQTDSDALGLAMTPLVEYRPIDLRGHVTGMGVRQLAEQVRSWNYHQAALGHAAINSWYNRAGVIPWDAPHVIETTPGKSSASTGEGLAGKPMFWDFRRIIAGKKVAIVGHTDSMLPLREICDLTILERIPRSTDLPDPACEYVLPKQDVVFITGSSFTNKTAARLIELSEDAVTVLWGPSVPLCPALFDLGVDVLLGQVVVDAAETARIACEGGLYMDFRHATRSAAWFADETLAGLYATQQAG